MYVYVSPLISCMYMYMYIYTQERALLQAQNPQAATPKNKKNKKKNNKNNLRVTTNNKNFKNLSSRSPKTPKSPAKNKNWYGDRAVEQIRLANSNSPNSPTSGASASEAEVKLSTSSEFKKNPILLISDIDNTLINDSEIGIEGDPNNPNNPNSLINPVLIIP